MTTTPDQSIGNMEGEAALPRNNGELVFEAPWEGRAFGIAVALQERGFYDWPAFRDQLVAAIAASDAKGGGSSYYERWLAALEKLLLDRGLIQAPELERRAAEYEAGLHDEDGHIH